MPTQEDQNDPYFKELLSEKLLSQLELNQIEKSEYPYQNIFTKFYENT